MRPAEPTDRLTNRLALAWLNPINFHTNQIPQPFGTDSHTHTHPKTPTYNTAKNLKGKTEAQSAGAEPVLRATQPKGTNIFKGACFALLGVFGGFVCERDEWVDCVYLCVVCLPCDCIVRVWGVCGYGVCGCRARQSQSTPPPSLPP